MMTNTPVIPVSTPAAQDLGSLSRDLRFHPVHNSTPDFLNLAQIEAFNRDGYLTGIKIFSEGEIGEIRAGFDSLLDTYLRAGKDSYSIATAHMKHAAVYDLLTHPRILQYVRDLLGPDVIAWGSHFFCKLPGDGKKVSWHQDAAYWPLTPTKAVTVWLAIDDADDENACVRFIPGSHLHGELTSKLHEEDENEILYQSVADAESFGEPVSNVLKAGSISIHSDLLLHGSLANESSRRRCGLTLRYCTPDVTAYLDWYEKGIIACGTDATGNWANPSRPAVEFNPAQS